MCTTWLVDENKYYLIDVLRGRPDFPTLRRKVSEQAKLHKASQISHPRCRVWDSVDPGIQDSGFLGYRGQARVRQENPNGYTSRQVRERPGVVPEGRLDGFEISKRNFSRFQMTGTTIRWIASARPWRTEFVILDQGKP